VIQIRMQPIINSDERGFVPGGDQTFLERLSEIALPAAVDSRDANYQRTGVPDACPTILDQFYNGIERFQCFRADAANHR